jgi:hypothetical protein
MVLMRLDAKVADGGNGASLSSSSPTSVATSTTAAIYSVANSTTSASTSSPHPEVSSGLGSGAKVGIGIGVGVGGLAILGLGILLLFRYRRVVKSKQITEDNSGSYLEHHSGVTAVEYISEPKELETPPVIHELAHIPPASRASLPPDQ